MINHAPYRFKGSTVETANKRILHHSRMIENNDKVTCTALWNSKNPNEIKKDSELEDAPNGNENDFLKRFYAPRIDDIGLLFSDVVTAQIFAPSFQIFWLVCNQAALPSWLRPISRTLVTTRGALVAPALIHGANLAVCWVLGALAAKGFESEAFDISKGKGYGTVLVRIFQAGAFATGLLILAMQVDLFIEFGRTVHWGESEDIDFRLRLAVVELINDVFFEALTLTSWRVYHANLMAKLTDE